MLGHVEKARTVLNSLPRSVEPHIQLTATLGLLRLLEGDREDSKRLYEKAESLARESGKKDLSKQIRQKMYLELARAASRKGDLTLARAEATRGIAVRPPVAFSYRRQLEELLATL